MAFCATLMTDWMPSSHVVGVQLFHCTFQLADVVFQVVGDEFTYPQADQVEQLITLRLTMATRVSRKSGGWTSAVRPHSSGCGLLPGS